MGPGTVEAGAEPRWWRWAVAAVLLGALALRLSAAANSPFIGDELDLMRFARGGTAGRPLPTLKHPPLALLLMRIPLSMGLEEPAQVRLPFVLLGVLGLAFAYRLAREGCLFERVVSASS